MKNGDKVIVNHDLWNLNNVEATIVERHPTDEYALAYFGRDNIVKDTIGRTFAVSPEHLSLERDTGECPGIKKGDPIRLKEKTKGTQRLFYAATEVYNNGVSFIDDVGNTRTLSFKHVEPVDLNDYVGYFNDLQNQIEELRRYTVETLTVLQADINVGIRNIMG